MIRISAIICTYNRANNLLRSVESLVKQTIDRSSYEIIVVENGCTDNTNGIVKGLQVLYPGHNIILVHEGSQGAGRARNTGVKHSRGDILAFMDDDAQASSNWLEESIRCFDRVKPTPLGIGGPILPFYDSTKPKWFKDEYEIRKWGEQPRFLNQDEAFSGSNMIFKKEVFKKLDGFATDMEIRGEYLILGEDTCLFKKMWYSLGRECLLYYLPELRVFHTVPTYKMSVRYRLKRAFAVGQSLGLQERHKPMMWKLSSLNKMVGLMAKFLASILVKGGGPGPYIRNKVIESFSPILTDIGIGLGLFGFTIPLRQRPLKRALFGLNDA